MATDYISREAAFQAIEDIDENAGARGSGFTDPERIMRDSAFYALEALQPADVVEVVRCKECIHDNSNDPICPIPWVKRMLDSYCSFGERRAYNG